MNEVVSVLRVVHHLSFIDKYLSHPIYFSKPIYVHGFFLYFSVSVFAFLYIFPLHYANEGVVFQSISWKACFHAAAKEVGSGED